MTVPWAYVGYALFMLGVVWMVTLTYIRGRARPRVAQSVSFWLGWLIPLGGIAFMLLAYCCFTLAHPR